MLKLRRQGRNYDGVAAAPAVNALKLLADPQRLRIAVRLAGREWFVNELCEDLGLTQPALSHHLELFRLSGLALLRRDGKFNYYRLNRDAVAELLGPVLTALGVG